MVRAIRQVRYAGLARQDIKSGIARKFRALSDLLIASKQRARSLVERVSPSRTGWKTSGGRRARLAGATRGPQNSRGRGRASRASFERRAKHCCPSRVWGKSCTATPREGPRVLRRLSAPVFFPPGARSHGAKHFFRRPRSGTLPLPPLHLSLASLRRRDNNLGDFRGTSEFLLEDLSG